MDYLTGDNIIPFSRNGVRKVADLHRVGGSPEAEKDSTDGGQYSPNDTHESQKEGHSDKSVAGVFDLIGLLLALPFGDELYRNDFAFSLIKKEHWVFLGLGIAAAAFGHLWPLVKKGAPGFVSASVLRTAKSDTVWILVCLGIFFYIFGPELVRRAAPAAGHIPTSAEIAEAVANRLPKAASSVPSLDEFAKAVAQRLPVPPSPNDIAKAITPIISAEERVISGKESSLEARLDTVTKERDTLAANSKAARSSTGENDPKSPILSLDDGARWRLANAIQDTAADTINGKQIECNTVDSIDAGNRLATDLFGEFYPVRRRAWPRFATQQGFPPPPHQPFGITFVVSGHNGDAFTCANHMVGVLQNALKVPVRLLTDQSSDNLTRCDNKCIEIRYGGER
jgi:hypothetical protein